MNRLFLTLLLIPALAHAQADKPPVDSLNQGQMQEIFHQLQSKSLTAPRLTDEELNRAAIQGLLQRLGTGASLLPIETTPPPARKLISELFNTNIAYLRPASFTVEEIPRLDVSLDSLAKSTATTLVLDLRAPAAQSDPIAATQFLSRFLPDATPLFQVRKAGEEKPRAFVTKGKPRWSKSLLLLVDSETNNAAETIAAVLQQKLRCYLIGSPTPGHAIEYRLQPVSPTHQLRIAQSEVVLEGGRTIFGQGLQPDLIANMASEVKNKQFIESETSGMKRFAYETERPRMNEAALVAQTNPELGYQIAKSANQTTPFDIPAANDAVLQQAIDFLTAQDFLKLGLPPEERKAAPK